MLIMLFELKLHGLDCFKIYLDDLNGGIHEACLGRWIGEMASEERSVLEM